MAAIWSSLFGLFGRALFALLSFIVLLVLAILFVIMFALGLSGGLQTETDSAGDYRYLSGDKNSDNHILKLHINGLILGTAAESEESLGLLDEGISYGYEIRKALNKAAEDERIKAVLLHMQTPGGTIYGSRAIFTGIKEYQEQTGQPVYAYIEGLAASGGVMAMVGADKIYADHGSMIGSIGVIGGLLRYYDKPKATEGGLFGGGIVTEGGIEHTSLSAGFGKDLGNPFRRATERELATLQQGLDYEYEQFVEHVAEQRSMDAAVIRNEMGAQIFDNATAQSYGLIDGTLDYQEALAALAEAAEISDDYQLVQPHQEYEPLLSMLVAAFRSDASPQQRAQQQIQRQLCATTVHLPLVYYGHRAALCR